MKHMRFLVLVIAMLALMSGLFAQIWMQSKDAVINQTDNAGTGYQVRFIVHYGTGTDSGENVYLGEKCRSDFGDIRFYEGQTALNYWMESMTSSSEAVFWVKLNGNLSNGPITVTLLYGNSEVTTTSNGANTFEFFDDFSSDLSKWTMHKTLDGSTITIPSGENYVRCGGGITSGTYGHTVLGSSNTYDDFANNAVEYRYRVATDGICEVGIRGTFGDPGSGYKGRSDARSNQGSSIQTPPYYGWRPLSDAGYDADTPSVNVWYRGTFTAYEEKLKLYRDGSLKCSSTLGTVSGPGEISLQNHYGNYTDYDWVAVRKFAGTEPTRGSWGEEVTLPVELSSFTASFSTSGFVTIYWVTQSETNVYGYYIYRGRENNLATAQIVSPLIPGTNTATEQSYAFRDRELSESGLYYYWLQNVDYDSSFDFHGPITVDVNFAHGGNSPEIPIITSLKSVYPNPFNSSTAIVYGVEKSAAVEIRIFNTKGQLVREYAEGTKEANTYTLQWDGKDHNGNECPSGVYLIQMKAGDQQSYIKALLQK
ncbi:MAG: hypothetical protein PWP64_1167 [Candidatus Cloacimonadota bacterium]|nr:hypothetical protein [Candidatus Cloacimonadota bacterium]